jgi:hypothetical protein
MCNVATIAYRLWEERGRPHGDDWTDWFNAERIVAEWHECYSCAKKIPPRQVVFGFEELRAHHACKFCDRFLEMCANVDTQGYSEESYKLLGRLTDQQLVRKARRIGYRGEHDHIKSKKNRRDAIEEFVHMGAHTEHALTSKVIGT